MDKMMTPDDVALQAQPVAAYPTPPSEEDQRARLMDDIVEMLKTCYDPEIPVDIWELGLIYRVDVDSERKVSIDMTLTSPNCPVAGELPEQVRQKVASVDGVEDCKLEIVWEPPWHPGMMSDVAKIQLDMF